MYPIFFIHSLIEGSEVVFHFMTFMIKAAMNIIDQVPCSMTEHPLGIFARVLQLGLEVDQFSEKTTILISKVSA